MGGPAAIKRRTGTDAQDAPGVARGDRDPERLHSLACPLTTGEGSGAAPRRWGSRSAWRRGAPPRSGVHAAGAEVGYSRADLIGANADIVESKRGAITGVYLHFPVSPVVAIRPELLFSLRGGQTVVGIAGTDDLAVADLEFAYLELPLLAQTRVASGTGQAGCFRRAVARASDQL